MTLTATYYSPAVPGDLGFSVDLAGDNRPRLGSIAGLAMECELGSVGISSLRFDDPTGTAGHAGDAVIGLKQLRVTESEAVAGRRRIFTGYIGDRRYSRGGGDSPSLVTEAARIIDMTVVDINSFLAFRVFTDTAATRPAETDVARITWLLGHAFLSTTIFDNGLVSSAVPVLMDATDYKGQRPVDVLNDCAQQSGKNFFVYYDDSGSGEFSLFYDFNDSLVYLSSVRVSNVLSDVDRDAGGAAIGPTWPPFEDATLVRDPSRVIAGAYIPNGSNSVYRTRPATATTYGWRDAVAPAPTLTTVAAMNARADRYLGENGSEDDRLTLTLELPAAHVNDWREGEAAQVRFSHLPGYEAFRYVRALRRTVMQTKTTDRVYQCEYECTPMAPQPQGAFSQQVDGVSFSGIPILPHATTPGNVLLAAFLLGGNTTLFPADPRFLDDPAITGLPATPPYADHATWTVLGTSRTDYSGMAIGGPCGGFSTTPYCTAGVCVGWAWRYVAPGEVTTHPVAISAEDAHDTASIWLWELPPTAAPVAGQAIASTHIPANPAHEALPTATGRLLTIFGYPNVDYGDAPHAYTVDGTAVKVQGAKANNDPTLVTRPGSNAAIISDLSAGGIAGATITDDAAYPSQNVCAVQIAVTLAVALPTIPYPANQVG